MKQFRHLMTMAALALTGATMTACSGDDEPVPGGMQPESTTAYTLTTTLTFDGGGETRALTEAGVKTFAVGDQIAVKYYKNGKDWDYETATSEPLTAADITDEGKTATITVTLTDPVVGKTDIRYVYPAYLESDIGRASILENKQDGSLAKLAEKFDYAEAAGNIDYSGGTPALPALTLQNQLALAKFTFSDGSADITASLRKLLIEDGAHTYFVTPSSASEIWVALYPVGTDQTIKLMPNDGAQFYEKSVTGKALVANNIYPISVTTPATTDSRLMPLTIEAWENGAEVSFKLSDAVTRPVEYRTCLSGTWGAWTGYTSNKGITLPATGDKVCFRGTNAKYDQSTISCTSNCYLYGNVMSLIDPMAFPALKELTEEQTFQDLFNGNKHINIDAARPFLLPATTLRNDCYESMFSGCANLTVAPALPATNLADACYKNMFQSCGSLEHGPLLPATSLKLSCYEGMFNSCGSLKSVICLATEYIVGNINDMLYYAGNPYSGEKPTFYKAPGATWPRDDDDDGANGIPKFWNVEDYSVTP
ncbi:MAG: hypothetical protein K6F20_05855 [Bacteroidaceae bacterium]|nr:hypothetical protein [Bacteroidaceae bacterium]